MNKPARKNQPLVGTVEDPGKNLVVGQTPTPTDLLAIALHKGASMEQIEKLMQMKERWDANEARKAFVAAMADFKLEDLAIGKNKHVAYRNNKNQLVEYDHAELFDITDVVVPALARHGISHGWSVKQDAGRITVVCTLTHRMGHRESVEMTAGADESGSKNSIQAIASTKTYLERYTLLAVTGLATGGDLGGESTDDDGRSYQEPEGDEDGDGDPRGDMPAQMSDADKAERRRLQCAAAAGRWPKNIEVIRVAAADYDLLGDEKALQRMAEAWREIPQEDQMALWLATTKGGVLSTFERELISTKLPKASREEDDHG